MRVRARACVCVREGGRREGGKAGWREGGREGRREGDETDTGCVGARGAVSRNQGLRAVCFLNRK